ncbi:F-box protein [Hibiscus syriacus]|uniref:F-box protein n=1 Tax=Hibiscus syriacus TaxID=106335 RepID=A0A6A3AUF0_HIBSY|nr:F-box protein [Hibiscus syriacus]
MSLPPFQDCKALDTFIFFLNRGIEGTLPTEPWYIGSTVIEGFGRGSKVLGIATDLKQLFNVSKSIREATVIAKQSYFAYSTPTKVKAFRTSIDLEEASEIDDIEALNAPRQLRSHRSINRKKLVAISVALFD